MVKTSIRAELRRADKEAAREARYSRRVPSGRGQTRKAFSSHIVQCIGTRA